MFDYLSKLGGGALRIKSFTRHVSNLELLHHKKHVFLQASLTRGTEKNKQSIRILLGDSAARRRQPFPNHPSHRSVKLKGLGFRVSGLGLVGFIGFIGSRDWGLSGLGSIVSGLGSRVSGLGFRV